MRKSWLVFGLAASLAARAATGGPFVFRDATDEAGILPAAAGIQGHGAGWGDADGDGFIDLYIGTFHKKDARPNLFFRNVGGKFQVSDQEALAISTRATGILFADLDNDGDLDLYVGSMPQVKNGLVGCTLFRNDGGGRFTNIAKDNGACPEAFGGRSVAAVDYDGDGLLDLLVGEDPLSGYNGSPTRCARLFRNLGNLKFEDVSRAAGLPELPALGVAAGDLNNDGWPDLFMVSTGSNVLLLNDTKGHFNEPAGSRERFAWPGAKGDNMVCGICFGDVNRDGLLDVLLGQHFEKPWVTPVANRLFLNRGVKNGAVTFEEVTEAAGLIPLPMKSPHVEIQDLDNDGWPDLTCSVVKFAADGTPHPVIFRNAGATPGGSPRFEESALKVNGFPTDEDQATGRTVTLFNKMITDKKIIYMAAGPTGDYDNDGRLDFLLPSWWPEGRSLLLHNETNGGGWLDVRVEGAKGVNRMGIGARVKVYRAGQSGKPEALLGCCDISIGYGYASGQTAIAHFGLGDETIVDVEVALPHGKGTLSQKGVAANRRVTVK